MESVALLSDKKRERQARYREAHSEAIRAKDRERKRKAALAKASLAVVEQPQSATHTSEVRIQAPVQAPVAERLVSTTRSAQTVRVASPLEWYSEALLPIMQNKWRADFARMLEEQAVRKQGSEPSVEDPLRFA